MFHSSQTENMNGMGVIYEMIQNNTRDAEKTLNNT